MRLVRYLRDANTKYKHLEVVDKRLVQMTTIGGFIYGGSAIVAWFTGYSEENLGPEGPAALSLFLFCVTAWILISKSGAE